MSLVGGNKYHRNADVSGTPCLKGEHGRKALAAGTHAAGDRPHFTDQARAKSSNDSRAGIRRVATAPVLTTPRVIEPVRLA